ncbi:carbonic anhydrase [Corynebacterium uterequi]|uniref:Carbonic anhydrase n=1 Tax=Corynebacterium uterequi TaxID=1072256 RepID=A0A0G3HIU1_9CORY|nr:carbonic anhydrase [Corynebacterium uterequi]AKK11858.1 carbonic anhydrase [Corynebacterium uterequi]
MSAETHDPSPAEAWRILHDGNVRFAAEDLHHPNLDWVRRHTLRSGQNPIAVVLACSDSRVPVEIIFDAGLGDVFTVRTAGEILGEEVMGSVSYAVNSLHVPLVIVLGHEGCGAVSAASKAIEGEGHIPGDHRRILVEKVAPSILKARGEGHSEPTDFERYHAVEVAKQLIERMPKLRAKVEHGEVGILAGRYRLSDGLVETVHSWGMSDTP